MQGMETLGVRMEKHISNTRAVVDFLNGHDAVADVAHLISKAIQIMHWRENCFLRAPARYSLLKSKVAVKQVSPL